MSKRLQVVVGDDELDRYQAVAATSGLTVSAWVRQTLRAAERQISTGDVEAKLAAVARAAAYNFPAPDIDTMLAEIEAGYRQDLDD